MPKLQSPIYINDYSHIAPGSVSEAGSTIRLNDSGSMVAALDSEKEAALNCFLNDYERYQNLDRSVQLALFVASKLQPVPQSTGINIGSSRGATGLWELEYDRFRESETVNVQTSPLTTLGNISSWTGQFLGLEGPHLSHSITCATSGHAILNSIAWLNSGMVETMIAGGSESPLTSFTIAQMKALRIYSKNKSEYPCRALDLDKSINQMVLGEGTALFVLSKEKNNARFKVTGYGTAIETLESATSVSKNGQNLIESMQAAIGDMNKQQIDAIVTHAPGTLKGDLAEFNAIQSVFGTNYPKLLNNKWQIGHTLGASNAMSIVTALEAMTGKYAEIPYLSQSFTNPRGLKDPPKQVLINATGFGGNAVSLLVQSCP